MRYLVRLCCALAAASLLVVASSSTAVLSSAGGRASGADVPLAGKGAANSTSAVTLAAAGATITVNSLSDAVANDGLCTLREAITSANTNTVSGLAAGECAAGTGDDTISFSVTGTIQLGGALPNIASNMTITGPGSALLTVRRNTGGDYRIFTVTSGLTVSISGMTVTNGKTPDGAPGNFGGSGGSGGGIFNSGTLTLTDATVTANTTGAGGTGVSFGGAGGTGGGIYNIGTLTMTNCAVTGNVTARAATGTMGAGMAAAAAGSITRTR